MRTNVCRLLVLVRLHVLTQMVAAHEALATDVTREPFLSRVRSNVTLQLVGACEPLATEEPVTDERSLARVPPQVRLQVRRLVVDLAATGNVACVHVALAHATGRLESIGFLAVGTVARRPAGVSALRSRVRERGAETRMCEEASAGGHVGTEASGTVQHRFVSIRDKVLLSGSRERRRVASTQLAQSVLAVRVCQRRRNFRYPVCVRGGVCVVHVPPGGAGGNVRRQLRFDANCRLVVDLRRWPRIVVATGTAASSHPGHPGIRVGSRRE